VLSGWQKEIVDAFPGRFLRGLIHTGGEPCAYEGAGLRLSALPVLESIGRYSEIVHRRLRRARSRVAAMDPVSRIRSTIGLRSPARQICWPEGVRPKVHGNR
jgi:hypothetical protein